MPFCPPPPTIACTDLIFFSVFTFPLLCIRYLSGLEPSTGTFFFLLLSYVTEPVPTLPPLPPRILCTAALYFKARPLSLSPLSRVPFPLGFLPVAPICLLSHPVPIQDFYLPFLVWLYRVLSPPPPHGFFPFFPLLSSLFPFSVVGSFSSLFRIVFVFYEAIVFFFSPEDLF